MPTRAISQSSAGPPIVRKEEEHVPFVRRYYRYPHHRSLRHVEREISPTSGNRQLTTQPIYQKLSSDGQAPNDLALCHPPQGRSFTNPTGSMATYILHAPCSPVSVLCIHRRVLSERACQQRTLGTSSPWIKDHELFFDLPTTKKRFTSLPYPNEPSSCSRPPTIYPSLSRSAPVLPSPPRP